jgi:hypothetical protein
MSVDSEAEVQMSPKEVAEAKNFEAQVFRADWAKAGL